MSSSTRRETTPSRPRLRRRCDTPRQMMCSSLGSLLLVPRAPQTRCSKISAEWYEGSLSSRLCFRSPNICSIHITLGKAGKSTTVSTRRRSTISFPRLRITKRSTRARTVQSRVPDILRAISPVTSLCEGQIRARVYIHIICCRLLSVLYTYVRCMLQVLAVDWCGNESAREGRAVVVHVHQSYMTSSEVA